MSGSDHSSLTPPGYIDLDRTAFDAGDEFGDERLQSNLEGNFGVEALRNLPLETIDVPPEGTTLLSSDALNSPNVLGDRVADLVVG